MTTRTLLAATLTVALSMGLGCKREPAENGSPSTTEKQPQDSGKSTSGNKQDHHQGDGHDDGDHGHGDEPGRDDHSGHAHGDGDDHGDHAHGDDHGHGHGDEIKLGTMTIGDMAGKVSQGHGKIQPGNESHLVIKLPYTDNGATVVRAWLGTKNRTLSFVGKGSYAAKRGEYSIHAEAPNPIPDNVMWWIEIEKPDGSKLVGSIKPHS
jgi:hypothetical protein